MPRDPHRGRQLVLRHPDGPADQVRRLLDPTGDMDVDAVVAERPRGEHRDRDERSGLGSRGTQRGDVGRQRHLRGVELAVAQHPEEGLLDRKAEVGQLQALGTDRAVGEGAGAVVVLAGEAEGDAAHAAPSTSMEWEVDSGSRTGRSAAAATPRARRPRRWPRTRPGRTTQRRQARRPGAARRTTRFVRRPWPSRRPSSAWLSRRPSRPARSPLSWRRRGRGRSAPPSRPPPSPTGRARRRPPCRPRRAGSRPAARAAHRNG
jgi:hypothetical protein